MKTIVNPSTPPTPAITQIGSLPHHNIDAAIAYSFQSTVPFLPQIPIRNTWEYMIPQALDGLPGLEAEEGGEVFLNFEVWSGRKKTFSDQLKHAFSQMEKSLQSFDAFEPKASTSSCWHPFLWELEDKNTETAKVQIAGPMTCQWVLNLKNGSPASKHTELTSMIYELITARALAMTRRIRSLGIKPLLFLDEPGLFAFQPSNPLHSVAFRELRFLIDAIRKDGASVGLHCCSDTDWKSVLELNLDFISIDTHLSLPSLLLSEAPLKKYLDRGGKLSLGIIPTSENTEEFYQNFNVEKEIQNLLQNKIFTKEVLKSCLFTPACGLALQTTSNAEFIQENLKKVLGLVSDY